jgi:hypothetical protein
MRKLTAVVTATSLLALTGLAQTGCATLFAGGPDTVQVTSNPPGARVNVDGRDVGVTPMVVTLDRDGNQGLIRLEAPGYQPAVVQRAKTFNTIAILNCLGVLGWIIDLATGNVKKFDDSPINVNLVPGGAPPPGAYPTTPVAPPPADQGPGSLRKPQ